MSANPALDVCLRIPQLAVGAVERARSVRRLAGGKAVHVALAARALGAPVTLVGWFGGANGARCQAQLAALELPTIAVPTRGETRLNIELLDDENRSTEVLEPGGPVEPDEVEQFVEACGNQIARLSTGDALVLSGSLPSGAPLELFARLVTLARRRQLLTIVDTSGAALEAALTASPDWIKPNHEEAGSLLGYAIQDTASALAAAHALRARGAAHVVISRGKSGLVATDERCAFEARSAATVAQSAVGCGDAAVAGLVVASLRGASMSEALKLAVACGYANCRATSPGNLSQRWVEQALTSVEVIRLTAGAA